MDDNAAQTPAFTQTLDRLQRFALLAPTFGLLSGIASALLVLGIVLDSNSNVLIVTGILFAIFLIGFGYVLGQIASVGLDMIAVWLRTWEANLKTVREHQDATREQLAALATKLGTAGAAEPATGDLSNLSTAELLEQLADAKKLGEADDVLDLRDSLVPRLPEHKKMQMDSELAQWFLRFFEKALRSGRAPLVAQTLGRAVEALQGAEGMEHLEQALPMVRQSAGLCVQCGKPYRGSSAICPSCVTQSESDDSEDDFSDSEDD